MEYVKLWLAIKEYLLQKLLKSSANWQILEQIKQDRIVILIMRTTEVESDKLYKNGQREQHICFQFVLSHIEHLGTLYYLKFKGPISFSQHRSHESHLTELSRFLK